MAFLFILRIRLHYGECRFLVDHWRLPLLPHGQIATQSNGQVIDDLHNTENGNAHEETEKTSTVGKEVGLAVQLWPFGCDKLGLLEEDGQAGQLNTGRENYRSKTLNNNLLGSLTRTTKATKQLTLGTRRGDYRRPWRGFPNQSPPGMSPRHRWLRCRMADSYTPFVLAGSTWNPPVPRWFPAAGGHPLHRCSIEYSWRHTRACPGPWAWRTSRNYTGTWWNWSGTPIRSSAACTPWSSADTAPRWRSIVAFRIWSE